jgi:hypothetical protein
MTGLDSRGIGERSALASVEPSITWGTITNIKTTEVPLNLRAKGFPGASLNALGIAVIMGVSGDRSDIARAMS